MKLDFMDFNSGDTSCFALQINVVIKSGRVEA
jgi:hypothetical protein